MNKGERTRLKILKDAMKYASTYGLSKVTIGEISKLTNMSRTGVISHFKDKEDMQISILQYSQLEYVENVIKKSYDENSLQRLRNYFKNWINWINELELGTEGSCPFIKAVIDYQDREESLVQTFVKKQQKELVEYIEKLITRCVEDGHFKKDTDIPLVAFQAYSFYIAHNMTKNIEDKTELKRWVETSIDDLISRSLA